MLVKLLRKASTLVFRSSRKIVLHPHEAVLMIRMAGWMVILSVLVKLTSLLRALEIVSTQVRHEKTRETDVPGQLARAIDLLLAMDVPIFRKSCWKRAIILHRYLALHGIESRINFGLRKELDGKVTGHAWLESRGEALLEDTLPEYTVTFTFPPASDVQNQFSLPAEIQQS